MAKKEKEIFGESSLDQMSDAELAELSDEQMLALLGFQSSAELDDPDKRMLYFALRRTIVEKRKQELASQQKGQKTTEDWERFKKISEQEFYQTWGAYDPETKEINYKRSQALMLRAAESLFKCKGIDAVREYDQHQQDLIDNRIDRLSRFKQRKNNQTNSF